MLTTFPLLIVITGVVTDLSSRVAEYQIPPLLFRILNSDFSFHITSCEAPGNDTLVLLASPSGIDFRLGRVI